MYLYEQSIPGLIKLQEEFQTEKGTLSRTGFSYKFLWKNNCTEDTSYVEILILSEYFKGRLKTPCSKDFYNQNMNH